MADREAKIRIGGDTSGLDRALSKGRNDLNRFGRDVRSRLGDTLRSSFDGLSRIAGLAGLGGLAEAARATKLWNDRLVFLQQNTHLSRQEILGMNDQIQRAAVSFGASQDDLLKGIETYQAITGRAREFSGALEDFAVIAKATGAPLEAIANTAAAMSVNLGLSTSQFKDAFDILSAQGDKGAIQFNQMSGVVATLTAQFGRFRTKGVQGAAEMGAMLQVVRHGAGDASEAATQLEAILADLPHRAKKLEAVGVNVFADKGKTQLRDALDIIDEIIKKVPSADLGEILGERKEARLAFETIRKNREEIRSLMSTASMAGTNMQKFGVYSASATAGFDKAMASLRKTANELMMGALPRLVGEFQAIVSAIKWLVDHKDVAIAIIAAWKLAPSALSSRGGGVLGGGGSGALGGGMGGAVPVYVTNPGFAGAGPGGGLNGLAGEAARAETGMRRLERGLDIAGKALFAFSAGYAIGGAIADATGLSDMQGHSTNVTDYRKYGALSDEQVRQRVAEKLYGRREGGDNDDPFSTPIGNANYHALSAQKGSAKEFFPDASEGQSLDSYVANRRKGADAVATAQRISEPINKLCDELRRTQQVLAAQKLIATVDGINDKMNVAIKNSRHRRRAP